MNVLSLFDGMSCGQIALNRQAIKYGNYYASEIDKYAIKVTQANYPNTIQLGDVRHITASNLLPIHLLIGGSPCQGFSFAGKGLNFEDERSKLFFEFVRLLKECREINPGVKFLLENVRMTKKNEQVINNYLGCRPIRLNSALVSAQNRERFYWTNIPVADIPKNKFLSLSDILDNGEGVIKNMGIFSERNDKSMCIDANYFKGVDNHGQRTMVRCINPKEGQGKRIYDVNGKSPTMSGHALSDLKVKQTQQQNRVYDIDFKMTSLCNGLGSRHNIKEENEVRKLTPIECEKLQTVPDNYTNHVSNSQRYKMLGNGWTVDIIAHIFSFIKQ